LAATGPQGSAANSAGNVWTGPPATSAVADAATAPSVVMTSRYFTKANEKPLSIDPPNSWFHVVSGNPPFTLECPGNSFTEPPALLNGFDSLTAINDLLYPDEYEAATQWWNERNLYEKLVNNPGLTTNNGLMSNFVQSRAGTPLAQLLNARKSISTVANNTAASFTVAAEQAKNNIKNLSDQLGFNDSTSVMITDTALIASLKAAQATAGLNTNNWKAATDQNLGNIREVVVNITPTNLFEANEQWILMLYLDYPAKGLQPPAAMLQQLKTLALQCPLVVGPAAVSANTLYELLTGKQLKKENCAGGEERSRKNEPLPLVAIYPNPANERLEVSLDKQPGKDELLFTLYNHIGQTVLQRLLPDLQNSISTTALQNGLYFATITRNGQILSARKLTIIH